MKLLSYNNEIQQITGQLIDVFNNLPIRRTDENGITQKEIRVPCLYGGRSRILKYEENRNNTLKLPVMAINIQHISRNTQRVHSVNDGLFYQSDLDNYDSTLNPPVPIDIHYSLYILTKYQEDIFQIMSNFVVNFNQSIYVVHPNPKNTDYKLECRVTWNNDISKNFKNYDPKDPSRFYMNTSFIVQGYIWPGYGIGVDSSIPIKHINVNNDLLETDEGYKLDSWYAVPRYMTFDEYIENIQANTISEDNYDHLPILDTLTGNYFDNIYVSIDDIIYNPHNKTDLEYIIDNFDNTSLTTGFYNSELSSIIVPEYFETVDWYSIWQRMLSGDLESSTI